VQIPVLGSTRTDEGHTSRPARLHPTCCHLHQYFLPRTAASRCDGFARCRTVVWLKQILLDAGTQFRTRRGEPCPLPASAFPQPRGVALFARPLTFPPLLREFQ